MLETDDVARRDVETPGFALRTVPGTGVVLSGRLDVVVAADVRLSLAAAVDSGDGDLVLDVSRVCGVDATGLGVLVGAHRRARRSGRTLVLLDVPPPLARVLLLTRLDRVLRTAGTAAGA